MRHLRSAAAVVNGATPRRARLAPDRLATVGVLVAALLVFGLPAGRAPVWNPEAARFMLLARDILEHGPG
jgi:hypothetical protein